MLRKRGQRSAVDTEDLTVKITPWCASEWKLVNYLGRAKYGLIVIFLLMMLCSFAGISCTFRHHSTVLTISNLLCSYNSGSCMLLLYMLMLYIFKSTFGFEMKFRSQISNLGFEHSLLLKYLYEVIYIPPVTADITEVFDLVQNYRTCFGLTF